MTELPVRLFDCLNEIHAATLSNRQREVGHVGHVKGNRRNTTARAG